MTTMMTTNRACPLTGREGAGLLLDYLDRKLAPETAIPLERHIAVCQDCSRIVAAQREVWDALDAWRPVAVSEEFNDRLFARIAEEDSTAPARPSWISRALDLFRMPVMTRLVPAGAACLVLVGLFVYQAPETVPTAETAAVENVDVEAAETTLADVEALHQLESADDSSALQAL